MGKKAYLILENGKMFSGEYFGKEGTAIGELVFTTGMTGCLETLTDPTYYGQMVVHTFPLIGNYGVIPEEVADKKVALSAYIVHEWCEVPSNFRSTGDIDAYMKENGVIGICGIDTRQLTKLIRDNGVMNAIITDKPELTKEEKQNLLKYYVEDAVAAVCNTTPAQYKCENEKYKVVLWDFGTADNIKEALMAKNCSVYTLPYNATLADFEKIAPDGIVVSDGPGTPEENKEAIELIGVLCKKYPIFALSLGHQMLALSQGAKCEKLKYGHRGANQPVKHMESGCLYATLQNHGYEVFAQTLSNGKLTFVNENDKSCEGIEYQDIPAFSVQFYPGSGNNPCSMEALLNKFIAKIEEANANAAK